MNAYIDEGWRYVVSLWDHVAPTLTAFWVQAKPLAAWAQGALGSLSPFTLWAGLLFLLGVVLFVRKVRGSREGGAWLMFFSAYSVMLGWLWQLIR